MVRFILLGALFGSLALIAYLFINMPDLVMKFEVFDYRWTLHLGFVFFGLLIAFWLCGWLYFAVRRTSAMRAQEAKRLRDLRGELEKERAQGAKRRRDLRGELEKEMELLAQQAQPGQLQGAQQAVKRLASRRPTNSQVQPSEEPDDGIGGTGIEEGIGGTGLQETKD